jgi:UDP-N-acetylmuramyl tripeptide synthase
MIRIRINIRIDIKNLVARYAHVFADSGPVQELVLQLGSGEEGVTNVQSRLVGRHQADNIALAATTVLLHPGFAVPNSIVAGIHQCLGALTPRLTQGGSH